MPPLEGMRILVTGATGFLGKEVCRLLGEAKAQVYPVSRSSYDVRNEAELLTAVCLARPSAIVHLAAPHHDAPDSRLFRNTLLMGLNVAYAAALQQARLVWVAPRSCLPEEPPGKHGEKEKDRSPVDRLLGAGLNPSRPHEAAIRSVAALIQSYRERYPDWQAIGLLLPDLYGDGDSRGPVTLTTIKACAGYKPPEPEKEPREEHAFTLLHVYDAARAVLEACRRDPAPPAVLGIPGTRVKALELERFIAARLTGTLECIEEAPRKKGSAGDAAKLLMELGWAPAISLSQGLRHYWDSLCQEHSVEAVP